MKYILTFYSQEPVMVPESYNKILQAALLFWLGNRGYASFLHDRGYQRDKRSFKLYTFSEIMGESFYHREKRKRIFTGPVQICLTFYSDEGHQVIAEAVERRRSLRLGNNYLQLVDCRLVMEEYRNCVVETLSPVTIHSTLTTGDGRKKTYFYSPTEKDFSGMLRDNLLRKYKAYYGAEPENTDFKILPDTSGRLREIKTYYSGFQIRAWKGRFKLYGSAEMIELALLSGIGARNSIGFGCLIQKEMLYPFGHPAY